eukprot:TRINITY_DN54831_c0_g1_i1.p1 TRINITY_DN54831_c0_g1~~TRINITY_DN54831_c0_g1_i1.p1  ORF type:complete len:177 (-),score=49.42 TRINITY_DN54831_c0_g1_i1:28-558(-)
MCVSVGGVGMDDLRVWMGTVDLFFFFSSRRRHTRCREVSWARRCVQETGTWVSKLGPDKESFIKLPFTGLLGEAVKSNKVTHIRKTSFNPLFNPLVDINTTESIRNIPVFSEKSNGVIFAIQHINRRGSMFIDKDILEYLVKFINLGVENLEKLHSAEISFRRGFSIKQPQIMLIP